MGLLLYDHGESRWSTYSQAIEVLTVVLGMLSVFSESIPSSAMAYSKFTSESRKDTRHLPSRLGMLLCYAPAALVASMSFANNLLLRKREGRFDYATVGDIGSLKMLILSAALFIHLVKRSLEVLFVHRYSGKMGVSSSITISLSYLFLTINLILIQHTSEQLIPPAVGLTWVGATVFMTGNLGNFYHHLLLRGLRKGGAQKYVIPQGGLFGVFVAPHYVFEMVSFVGLTLISQTYYSAASAMAVILYLSSRGHATKKWYSRKIDGFPTNRWALIPYVF